MRLMSAAIYEHAESLLLVTIFIKLHELFHEFRKQRPIFVLSIFVPVIARDNLIP